jgi:hypothetical protein
MKKKFGSGIGSGTQSKFSGRVGYRVFVPDPYSIRKFGFSNDPRSNMYAYLQYTVKHIYNIQSTSVKHIYVLNSIVTSILHFYECPVH